MHSFRLETMRTIYCTKTHMHRKLEDARSDEHVVSDPHVPHRLASVVHGAKLVETVASFRAEERVQRNSHPCTVKIIQSLVISCVLGARRNRIYDKHGPGRLDLPSSDQQKNCIGRRRQVPGRSSSKPNDFTQPPDDTRSCARVQLTAAAAALGDCPPGTP